MRSALYGTSAVLALCLVNGGAGAADATWTGVADGDWNNAANWSPATPGGADQGTFDTSPNTFIDIGAPTSVGSLLFMPTADFFNFGITSDFTVNGAVTNNSANTQTFSVNSGASLSVVGGAVSGPLFLNNMGTVNFSAASAGGAFIANQIDNAVINFNAGSDAGTSVIDNQAFSFVNFNGNASAAGATINNSAFGAGTAFNGVSTASTATITNFNQAGTDFNDASTAGNATIRNAGTGGSGGRTAFNGTSNAGTATITNSGGFVSFNGNASAANARIANDETSTAFRSIAFNDASTAGSAVISTGSLSPPSAGVSFFDTSNAGTATITANSRGSVTFQDSSDARQATLIANSGGTVSFRLSSTGNQARLIANAGGTIAINQLTGAGTSAGSLEGLGTMTLGAKRLTIGTNNLSTEFGGVIQGAGGSLVKAGSGTLTLTGNNTYTGATVVDGGLLAINGGFASSGVTVNAGGALGGSGAVPSTVIGSGGTLAPGNSIGTITINGSLGFSAGSVYAVEVSPTAADRTVVTGAATLAGTVQASFAAGSYIYRSYTILSAAGLGGTTFNRLTTSNLPRGFAAALSYSGTEVFLTLTMARPVPGDGYTINQTAVFNGIANSFDLTGGLPGDFTDLTAGNLTQISGESATGGAPASFLLMDIYLNLMLDPFTGARPAADARAIGFAPETPRRANAASAANAYAAMTPRDRPARHPGGWNVWASAFGGSEKNGGNSTTGSHTNTTRAGGLAVGADYRVEAATLGFSLAGAGTDWGLSDNLGGGRSDTFLAGAYVSKRWGASYASAALAYAWSDVSTDRNLMLGGTGDLSGGYHADTLGARLEAGHRWAAGPFGLTPYAALQARRYRAPGYAETASTGTGTFALAYDAQKVDATATELGAWFDHATMLSPSATLTWRTRLAWSHEYNRDRTVTATFQTLPGSGFTVEGAAAPADTALVSAGFEFAYDTGWTIGAKFDGKFADGYQSYRGNATVRYAW